MIFSMSTAKEFFRSTKQNKNAVSRMSSVLKPVADCYHQKTQAERYPFRRLLRSLVKWYGYAGLLQNSPLKDITQNPKPFSELLRLKKVPGFCFVLFFRIATTRTRKKQPPESFESAVDFEISHVVDRGRTRTLSPERDFKSLVSASLRQIQFSFVVSFDFSLRERFFLREREGFALF